MFAHCDPDDDLSDAAADSEAHDPGAPVHLAAESIPCEALSVLVQYHSVVGLPNGFDTRIICSDASGAVVATLYHRRGASTAAWVRMQAFRFDADGIYRRTCYIV